MTPGSFDDELEVNTLLHHLSYQLWLWALTLGVPAIPAVPPPLPYPGGGRNLVRGIVITIAVVRHWNIPAHLHR